MKFFKKISYNHYVLLLIILFCFPGAAFSQAELSGVNLSGAEFGSGSLPGTYGEDYIYPANDEFDYFIDKGMNVFRLCFLWERLQPELNGEFDQDEFTRLNDCVNYATGQGAKVILDPHNYARYDGEIIGTENLPVGAFEDFWSRLAEYYKDNSDVIFGLMNEPHSMSSELWRDDANAAVAAIRGTGADNLILVPGNAWTGAHSWASDWYGTPNSETMLAINDPGDNMAFEVHQYLDDNSSGTSEMCTAADIGSQRLEYFTRWLRENNLRGFLGEFAGSSSETCLAAVDDMLNFIDENTDVWLGWTWWAAGPWWGDYMFSIEPQDGSDRPQMSVLEEHINTTDCFDDRYAQNMPGGGRPVIHYTNSCGSKIKIKISLERSEPARLEIVNSRGQTVKILHSEHLFSGTHSFVFDPAERLSAGIYFCRLSASEKIYSKIPILF